MEIKIGEKILKLRKEQGWSRAELAEKIGASESIISKYEQNINLPSIEMTLKLSLIFNVTTDYLIGNNKFGHFSKELMDKIEAIQNTDQGTRRKIFEIIDVYIRDTNTRQFIKTNTSNTP